MRSYRLLDLPRFDSCSLAILGLAVGALLALATGCDRAKPKINGLAGFELGETILADIPSQARCFENPKSETQRCILLPATQIAGRRPKVQLDFDGNAPQSKVTEIILTIPGCNYDQLVVWLDEKLGKTDDKAEKRAYWIHEQVFIAAEENGPARCYVTAVRPQDKKRVASLRGQAE